jgi:hypothetical protein
MSRADEVRRTCIQVAAEFVAAQDDGPRRALDQHRRRADGTCAGCRNAPVRWPCTTATIARLAAALPGERRRAAGPGT